MKCYECGATMETGEVRNYDATALLGLDLVISKMAAPTCPNGHGVALPGRLLNDITLAVSLAIVQLPHRMAARESRFLRKMLGLTQEELADRLGITRKTVNQWECNQSDISAQHDLILRTLVVASTSKDQAEAVKRMRMIAETLATLNAVRAQPAPPSPGPDPSVVQAFLDRLRDETRAA